MGSIYSTIFWVLISQYFYVNEYNFIHYSSKKGNNYSKWNTLFLSIKKYEMNENEWEWMKMNENECQKPPFAFKNTK